MNGQSRLSLALVLIGTLVNNYAYLHDLIYRGEDRIWMGPLSFAVAGLGIVIILVGAYRLAARPH